MKIVFFGTPHFSARVLEALIEAKIPVVGVVSKPDKPKGRDLRLISTAVKELIREKYPHIPLWQPEKVSDPSFAPILESLHADIFVVVAYGEILKEHILNMPKIACINVHTSLLPRWRGAAPIQRAVIAGDKESGVSIIHLVKKMDAGDIISQSVVPIGVNMTFGELEEAILNLSIRDLIKALEDLEKGVAARRPQDHEKATLAPKIELEECEIVWEKDASELHNLVRGVNPYPGAWTWVEIKGEKKRLKIFKTELSSLTGKPGEIINWGKGGWIVACGRGSLQLLDIQLEGKKRLEADLFMRGLESQSIKIGLT